MTALEQYERLSPDTPASWAALAADLRSEADQFTGDMRRKRQDRAIICEHRAIRQRAR